MKRNDTRSRSFQMKRLVANSSEEGQRPTTPATPGAFDYYKVDQNDPAAAEAVRNILDNRWEGKRER